MNESLYIELLNEADKLDLQSLNVFINNRPKYRILYFSLDELESRVLGFSSSKAKIRDIIKDTTVGHIKSINNER